MRTMRHMVSGFAVLCCAASAQAAGIFRVDAASTAETPVDGPIFTMVSLRNRLVRSGRSAWPQPLWPSALSLCLTCGGEKNQ